MQTMEGSACVVYVINCYGEEGVILLSPSLSNCFTGTESISSASFTPHQLKPSLTM